MRFLADLWAEPLRLLLKLFWLRKVDFPGVLRPALPGPFPNTFNFKFLNRRGQMGRMRKEPGLRNCDWAFAILPSASPTRLPRAAHLCVYRLEMCGMAGGIWRRGHTDFLPLLHHVSPSSKEAWRPEATFTAFASRGEGPQFGLL